MPKANIRVIPPAIDAFLKTHNNVPVIAACSRVYSAVDLAAGKLKHLKVHLKNGHLSHAESTLPDEGRGKYSFKNINGEEIVRKDLPKEIHYNSVESPNWGDDYNGTHTVDLQYKKYPRDFIAPALTQIRVSIPDAQDGLGSYLFIFEVDRILDPKSKGFRQALLECLNLLQENVGHCGIQKSGATVSDYLQTLKVSWEVLPPGTVEEAVARIFQGKQPSPEQVTIVAERYEFLMSLKPTKLVYGLSGLQRYFGGLIREDLVVFENVAYGNAIYIMFENWQALSQRSRTELLSGRYGTNFERVLHGSGWKGTVRKIIKQRLGKK